jgi:hypothetical protein
MLVAARTTAELNQAASRETGVPAPDPLAAVVSALDPSLGVSTAAFSAGARLAIS